MTLEERLSIIRTTGNYAATIMTTVHIEVSGIAQSDMPTKIKHEGGSDCVYENFVYVNDGTASAYDVLTRTLSEE